MNHKPEVIHAERLVSASELRRHQGKLLFEVQTEFVHLVVLRYGRPIALIVPLNAFDETPAESSTAR